MPPLQTLDPNAARLSLLQSLLNLREATDGLGYLGKAQGYHTRMLESSPGTLAVKTGQKRQREDEPRTNPEDIVLPGEDDGDITYDLNCNQIRNRINRFLESGEMKVTQFQKTLGINSNSYGRFMKLKGQWSGADNQTFRQAYIFFKKRELAGVKITQKKMKTEDKQANDVSDVHLSGEEDQIVPVYDTCDDIRNKINAHLRNTSTTKAELLRQISLSFPSAPKIQGVQLNTFLKYSGATQGCESRVYYGAYVFFEKLRIKQASNKSKKRLEIEKIHPGGMSTKAHRGGVWCFGNERPYEDQYGRISIV